MLLSGALAARGALTQGWLEIEREQVVAAGAGRPPRAADYAHDGSISAGLCDLQVNGAGGREVTDGSSALDRIDAIQLAHGVTSYLPTLVSPDDETAGSALAEIADRVADPGSPVAGVHAEGPFLNPNRAGMHPRSRLRSPAEGVPVWLDHPALRLVTLAPELPGAIELIAHLHARGVVVALGHSDADAVTARAAVDAGASMVTHVFNAMAPLLHRAPGLAGVALVDPRVWVAVIADGHHVDPLVLELTRRAAASRLVLVTDSTPAAASPAGRYEMAGVAIESAADGPAFTVDGRLAGSTLTLEAAVRNWSAMTEGSPAQALAAASEAPAAAIGRPAGLRPGAPADLVLLSSDGEVQRVMRRGRWLS
jgi:N-acetylglucosamine-6-phosphate deacetylase